MFGVGDVKGFHESYKSAWVRSYGFQSDGFLFKVEYGDDGRVKIVDENTPTGVDVYFGRVPFEHYTRQPLYIRDSGFVQHEITIGNPFFNLEEQPNKSVPTNLHDDNMELLQIFHDDAIRQVEPLVIQYANSVGWPAYKPRFGQTFSRVDRPIAWSHVLSKSVRWSFMGALFGLLIASGVWHMRQLRWRRSSCCAFCGYPAEHHFSVCPECGQPAERHVATSSTP